MAIYRCQTMIDLGKWQTTSGLLKSEITYIRNDYGIEIYEKQDKCWT